jgi:large subunit ribosomal protein L3
VRGAVPGAKNSWVLVRDAVKGTGKGDLPFPTALRGEAAAAPEQKEG